MQTYKYYFPTGERLGIFFNEGTIIVIPCSKNDQFSKKVCKEIYTEISNNTVSKQRHLKFNVHGFVKTQSDFLQWCTNHYKIIIQSTIPIHGKILNIEKLKKHKQTYNYELIKISYLY